MLASQCEPSEAICSLLNDEGMPGQSRIAPHFTGACAALTENAALTVYSPRLQTPRINVCREDMPPVRSERASEQAFSLLECRHVQPLRICPHRRINPWSCLLKTRLLPLLAVPASSYHLAVPISARHYDLWRPSRLPPSSSCHNISQAMCRPCSATASSAWRRCSSTPTA